MTPDDYRYVTNLVLGVAGAQTTIIGLFIGLLYQALKRGALSKRLELIESRLDKLEDRKVIR